MPKGKKLDDVQNARRVVDESLANAGVQIEVRYTVSKTVSRVMAEMGRRGGQIGGKRRLQTMTPDERKASARAAIKARWDRYRALKASETV
jgi:hypothetical protein